MSIKRIINKNDLDDTVYEYESKIGIFILKTDKTKKLITALMFTDDNYKKSVKNICEPTIVKQAKKQLDEYFNLKRKIFDIDVGLFGSDFQYEVWKKTYDIAFGELTTYGDIAISLKKENGGFLSRAVGASEGKNPVSIIVPCHRVVGKSGFITGYGGGLWRKEYLLNLEGHKLKNERIQRNATKN